MIASTSSPGRPKRPRRSAAACRPWKTASTATWTLCRPPRARTWTRSSRPASCARTWRGPSPWPINQSAIPRIEPLEPVTRRPVLLLPDGAAGRVTGSLPRDRSVPVEYGQVLILLAPVHAGDDDRPQTFAEALGGAPETGLLPRSPAVGSPTRRGFF